MNNVCTEHKCLCTTQLQLAFLKAYSKATSSVNGDELFSPLQPSLMKKRERKRFTSANNDINYI